jgi:hypothetical protein
LLDPASLFEKPPQKLGETGCGLTLQVGTDRGDGALREGKGAGRGAKIAGLHPVKACGSGASNDVNRLPVGPSEIFLRSSATTERVEGRLQFYALALVPVVARYMEDGEYKLDYPRFGTTTMERICKLPEGA